MHRMLLCRASFDGEDLRLFSSLFISAWLNWLIKNKVTALCLVEEEEVGASSEQYPCTHNYTFEIDEEKWCLYESKNDKQHGKDGIDQEYEPKKFDAYSTDIFFIGSALEHELFSTKFIIFKEPSNSNQFLACDVLGEPKINYYDYGYKLIDDKITEDASEYSPENKEANNDCFKGCMDYEPNSGIWRLD